VRNFKSWWQQWLLVTPGIFVANWAIEGLQAENWKVLLLVAVVLGTLNVVLKPILIIFALPFVIFTLGFGIVFINALLVLGTGAVVPGFEVASFWSAFWAGLIISLVSMVASLLLGDTQRIRVQMKRNRRRGGGMRGAGPNPSGRSIDSDVIDI
jgi:putative membrane protein